jgi:hypothetical protein
MPKRLFAVSQAEGAPVAGDVLTEASHLCLAVGKGQLKRVVLVDGRRDGSDLGVVAKQTEEMGLFASPMYRST